MSLAQAFPLGHWGKPLQPRLGHRLTGSGADFFTVSKHVESSLGQTVTALSWIKEPTQRNVQSDSSILLMVTIRWEPKIFFTRWWTFGSNLWRSEERELRATALRCIFKHSVHVPTRRSPYTLLTDHERAPAFPPARSATGGRRCHSGSVGKCNRWFLSLQKNLKY